MNEFSDLPLPNVNTNSKAPSEINLTPEQRLKTDMDIRTVHSLNEHAARKGVGYSISGGYAVEAHCGGVITRPHGDMDVEFMNARGFDIPTETTELTAILKVEADTNWKLQKSEGANGEGKVEFREDDPTKQFLDRRRLEADFITRIPKLAPQRRRLIDSVGNSYEISVHHIADLAATKIRILNDRNRLSDEERQQHKRQTLDVDKNELKRLLNQSHFKKEECIDQLSRTFYGRSKGALSWEEAQARAEQEWQDAMLLLQ